MLMLDLRSRNLWTREFHSLFSFFSNICTSSVLNLFCFPEFSSNL